MDTERRRTSPVIMVLVGFMIIQLVFNMVFIVDRAVFRAELNGFLMKEFQALHQKE